jgi:heme/copper-type cytochrome/quinol oxidase subunit 2
MTRSSTRRAAGRQIPRRQRKSNTPLIVGAVVGVIVILIAAGLLLRGTAAQVGQQVESGIPVAGQHIQNLTDPHPTYTSNPPTSGWHYVSTAPPGVQTQPLPDEMVVHNLEHGFVVIHYRQDLDQATVDQLTSLARELQQQNPCLILEPRPTDKLDVPVAATAWNWLLKQPTYNPEELRAFFKAHVGRGPEQICRPL